LWVLAAAAFVAIFFLGISFVVIILGAAFIGYMGGKLVPKQFPPGRGHGKPAVVDAPCVVLPPAPAASIRRTLLVSAWCVSLWWLPVLAAGVLLGWGSIQFQEGVFFSKAALVTVGGAYAVLPYVAQMAVDHHGWLDQRQMMAGLGLAETTTGPLIMVLQFVGFVAAWQNPGGLEPLAAATLGAMITTWVTFLPSFLFVFLGAPHVESLRERPALASTLSAITAAVAGVILNLAIWFAWHALRAEGGGFDYFVAVIALSSWLAMEHFKIGMIPTLAACAVFGRICELA
jgi:chromate transporter